MHQVCDILLRQIGEFDRTWMDIAIGCGCRGFEWKKLPMEVFTSSGHRSIGIRSQYHTAGSIVAIFNAANGMEIRRQYNRIFSKRMRLVFAIGGKRKAA